MLIPKTYVSMSLYDITWHLITPDVIRWHLMTSNVRNEIDIHVFWISTELFLFKTMCKLIGMMPGQILKKLLGHLKKIKRIPLYIEILCPEYHLYVFWALSVPRNCLKIALYGSILGKMTLECVPPKIQSNCSE